MTEPALVSPADLAARWSVCEDFVRRLCRDRAALPTDRRDLSRLIFAVRLTPTRCPDHSRYSGLSTLTGG